MALAYERADENTREAMHEALEPPNRIDPVRGVPYGWDEDTELDGFNDLIGR